MRWLARVSIILFVHWIADIPFYTALQTELPLCFSAILAFRSSTFGLFKKCKYNISWATSRPYDGRPSRHCVASSCHAGDESLIDGQLPVVWLSR